MVPLIMSAICVPCFAPFRQHPTGAEFSKIFQVPIHELECNSKWLYTLLRGQTEQFGVAKQSDHFEVIVSQNLKVFGSNRTVSDCASQSVTESKWGTNYQGTIESDMYSTMQYILHSGWRLDLWHRLSSTVHASPPKVTLTCPCFLFVFTKRQKPVSFGTVSVNDMRRKDRYETLVNVLVSSLRLCFVSSETNIHIYISAKNIHLL
jgi:hypothetical protein